MFTDSTHGEVAYLATTASVLIQPSSAVCEGRELEQILVSADRDIEGTRGSGQTAIAAGVFFFLFGLALRWYSRSLASTSAPGADHP